jgi:hypothetical protein
LSPVPDSLAFMRRCVAALLLAALSGCATLPPPGPALPADDCTRWFDVVDAAVDAAGVRDAQDERVPGFAFVRVDRLAVATRDHGAFEEWLRRTSGLDLIARRAELANLPPAAYPLGEASEFHAARLRTQQCRDLLSQRVLQDASLQRTLQERARVPDRYALAARTLGAYPLLRWPFFAGVRAWEAEHRATVAQWSTQPPPRQRFEPPSIDPHAPVFEIERAGDMRAGDVLPSHDRFGMPTWPSVQAAAPRIDSSALPEVFVRDSHTLVGTRLLRQRIYTLWFDERPPSSRFDLLAGTLDGVIVRLTFAPDDTVLMLDSIHACGCWHQFYPAPGVRPRDGAPTQQEWAFVPAPLPALAPGQRLVVRLASRTHHVSAVVAEARGAPSDAPYLLRDENALRSLPVEGAAGTHRSLYSPDGLVAGTERAERFIFWPMGIASAGAMRQWGHHATAFVGRRHFDDPNLLDARFVLFPGAPP